MSVIKEKLDVAERTKFRKLESLVAEGISRFVVVGEALKEIRDAKLYRESYKTFEKYVSGKWGFARSRAYQLIDAAETKANLSTIVDKNERASEITTEGQMRELHDVPNDALEAVIDKASEIAGDGKITASDIKQAKAEVLEYEDVPDREPGEDDETPEEPAEYAKPITLQMMDNTKYHREIHANICEALRLLAAVPEKPGTEMLISRAAVIKRELDHAKASIMSTKPHAICPRCKGAGCSQCGNYGWVNSALSKELG